MPTSDARRPVLPVAVPVVLAVTAAGAALLPWWRADRGAVLLGAGPLRELPPDTWTGVAVSGWWTAATAVPAGVAILATALAADVLHGLRDTRQQCLECGEDGRGRPGGAQVAGHAAPA